LGGWGLNASVWGPGGWLVQNEWQAATPSVDRACLSLPPSLPWWVIPSRVYQEQPPQLPRAGYKFVGSSRSEVVVKWSVIVKNPRWEWGYEKFQGGRPPVLPRRASMAAMTASRGHGGCRRGFESGWVHVRGGRQTPHCRDINVGRILVVFSLMVVP
jgi:hypothetical protein